MAQSTSAGRLLDKVAIVTGGASGIGKYYRAFLCEVLKSNEHQGRAICRAYAAEGAKVVVADIRETSADTKEKDLTIIELIQKEGGQAIFIKTDVSRSESVENLVREAVSKWGRLDM